MANKPLAQTDKQRIYTLYKVDNHPQSRLAALYRVSQSTIHRIIAEQEHIAELADQRRTFEAQIAEQKRMMERAMQKGVEAAAREKQRVINVVDLQRLQENNQED